MQAVARRARRVMYQIILASFHDTPLRRRLRLSVRESSLVTSPAASSIIHCVGGGGGLLLRCCCCC